MKTRKRGRSEAESPDKPVAKKAAVKTPAPKAPASKAPAPKAPAPGKTRASSRAVMESPAIKKSAIKKLPAKPTPTKGLKNPVVKTQAPKKDKVYKEMDLPFTRRPGPALIDEINKLKVPVPATKKTMAIKFPKPKGKSSSGAPPAKAAERRGPEEQESETTEPAVEKEDEHNYSKDPKGLHIFLNTLEWAWLNEIKCI